MISSVILAAKKNYSSQISTNAEFLIWKHFLEEGLLHFQRSPVTNTIRAQKCLWNKYLWKGALVAEKDYLPFFVLGRRSLVFLPEQQTQKSQEGKITGWWGVSLLSLSWRRSQGAKASPGRRIRTATQCGTSNTWVRKKKSFSLKI